MELPGKRDVKSFAMKGVAPRVKQGSIADGALVLCSVVFGVLMIYFAPELGDVPARAIKPSSAPSNASKPTQGISLMAYLTMRS